MEQEKEIYRMLLELQKDMKRVNNGLKGLQKDFTDLVHGQDGILNQLDRIEKHGKDDVLAVLEEMLNK